MNSIVTLILAELATVSFIVLPTLWGKIPFVLMMVLLIMSTELELYRVVVRSSQRRLLFLMLVYPWAFIATLLLIYNLHDGPKHVLYLFFIVEVNDSLAYIMGKRFGKKKIFPQISPKKTCIGLFSGFILSFIISLILGYFLFNTSLLVLALIVIITLIAGIAGDLLTSYIKRAVHIKDFNSLIPTQGGVLDAYDALIVAAPWYYLLIKGVS